MIDDLDFKTTWYKINIMLQIFSNIIIKFSDKLNSISILNF